MAKETDFETNLKELEQIVHNLEVGNLSLQEALGAFEKGIKLVNSCSQQLDSAEKKIDILLETSTGKKKLAAFNPNETT